MEGFRMIVNRRANQATVSALLVSLTLLQFASPAHSQDASMKAALDLYKVKKDYAAATDAFYKIAVSQPDNIEAFIYYANSLYMQKQSDKAIKAYWYVVRRFPSHKRGYEIKEYLKKLDPSYATHINDPRFASVGDSKSSATKTASIAAPSRASESVINDIVKTVKPLNGRPAVSPSLIDRTKDALRAYPGNLLQTIYDRGCRIWLTPTMIDKEPGLEHQQPSGYMEGHTYKDCPGMFYSGGIVVCEYTIGNGFDWDACDDPIGTLRHELGHAVDYYLGEISESEEYRHAYRLDQGSISDDATRNRLHYYMQKDIRGQHECFAELMAAKYGKGEFKLKKDETNALVEASFPRTMKVIDKRIAEAENK